MDITRDDLDALATESGVGLDADAFRTDYSGRGMYGDTCLGLVVEGPGHSEVTELAMAASELDMDDLKEALTAPSTDSMGLDTILYWPQITVTDN